MCKKQGKENNEKYVIHKTDDFGIESANFDGNSVPTLPLFLKKIIFSENFLNRNWKSEKDLTRKRILTFPILLMMLLNLRKGSIGTELGIFFKSLTKHRT
ncbi:MAG: hypothetical protein V1816_20575 [Pseudomonadota bacterium]